MTKKIEKKPRQMTLFFQTLEDCVHARDALNQSRRRPSDLDRSHAGNYSKRTGHYGQVSTNNKTYRVPIRFKLNIDAEAFESLTWEQKHDLRYVAGDDSAWIVR